MAAPSRTIRALVFDLDDTLLAESKAIRATLYAAAERTHEEHGATPEAIAEQVEQDARRLWRAGPAYDYCDHIGIATFEALAGPEPVAGGAEQTSDAHATLADWMPGFRAAAWPHDFAVLREERQRHHQLYDDALPALERARAAGLRLVLLTNGASAVQREKIDAVGLSERFDATFPTGEIGFGKPDPRPFRTALAAVDVLPSEALMIGDNLMTDILGGNGAGLATCWLARGERPGTAAALGIEPHAQIENLDQLDRVYAAS